ncbi:MAG: FAD synthase [Candidatus Diapherotrites archaeon]|nr:FAD synthase [Candidatus Diapherotrites archaeon]
MEHKKLVMAFGTFDFFHYGHLYYLERAKKLGGKLIVVVSRDENAFLSKGKSTLHNEKERLKVIKALSLVDDAVLGLKGNTFGILLKYKPDIIALGYDQRVDIKALKAFISKKGLKTRIKRIPAYKPHILKSSNFKALKKELQENKPLELGRDIL